MAAEDSGKKTAQEATCVCPFCHEAVEAWAPWCAVCQVEGHYCGDCEEPLPKEATVCPNCGAECKE